MNNLFLALVLICLACVPIALIYPKAFTFLLRKQATRGKVSLLFIGGMILFFILFGITTPPDATVSKQSPKQTSEKQIKKSETVVKKTTPVPPKATPTPDTKFATMTFNASGVLIKNNRNVPLKGCTVTSGYYQVFPGDNPNHGDWYEYALKQDIPANQSASVPWGWMTRVDNGIRFNFYQQAPENLMVECIVGEEDSFSTDTTNP